MTGVTDVTNPSLSGTAEPGSTVKLLNAQNTAIAQATAGNNGSYVIAVPGAPLAAGTYKFSVTASNPYGTSPASGTVTFRIVAAPATPSVRCSLPADSDEPRGVRRRSRLSRP